MRATTVDVNHALANHGTTTHAAKHTRHNIGFDILDAFVLKHGGFFKLDRLAEVAEVKWKGKIFICIKPTTYMNLSGKAFKYWLDKEKIVVDNTLTIVDDLALPIDKMRLRPSGSDAGHNGLKDIQLMLGTDKYAKLRFGIGNNLRSVNFEFWLHGFFESHSNRSGLVIVWTAL